MEWLASTSWLRPVVSSTAAGVATTGTTTVIPVIAIVQAEVVAAHVGVLALVRASLRDHPAAFIAVADDAVDGLLASRQPGAGRQACRQPAQHPRSYARHDASRRHHARHAA